LDIGIIAEQTGGMNACAFNSALMDMFYVGVPGGNGLAFAANLKLPRFAV